MKSDIFEKEIALIENPQYQEFIHYYLNNYVPDYFYTVGASSSGQYHPAFAQGDGGLVRHTKAVVMFVVELLKMSSYKYMRTEYKDFAIMACIVHDTCKYGIIDFDKEQYPYHAENAANNVADAFSEYFGGKSANTLFLSAIRCHMGQWSEKENRPFTNIDKLVHLSDYIASRKFIDIKEL